MKFGKNFSGRTNLCIWIGTISQEGRNRTEYGLGSQEEGWDAESLLTCLQWGHHPNDVLGLKEDLILVAV